MKENIKSRWLRLKTALELDEITQTAAANGAGISQSAVSRILRKCPARDGSAFSKLCNYALFEKSHKRVKRPDPSSSKELMAALSEVWNGTDAHADALAAIIRAAGQAARTAR
jgi:hypothetical protein